MIGLDMNMQENMIYPVSPTLRPNILRKRTQNKVALIHNKITPISSIINGEKSDK